LVELLAEWQGAGFVGTLPSSEGGEIDRSVEESMTNAEFVEKWERQRIRHVHRHKPVININQIDAEKLTRGQLIADRLATVMGSWPFIIVQSVILAIWIVLNVAAYINHWDPYPFILLNLALSFQAAYAAPIIMMSQNRQAAKDRLMAEQDYEINCKAEDELKSIMNHLEQQDEVMLDILRRMEGQHQVIMGKFGLMAPDGNAAPA
jgi:uncharacterized membrane protein